MRKLIDLLFGKKVERESAQSVKPRLEELEERAAPSAGWGCAPFESALFETGWRPPAGG